MNQVLLWVGIDVSKKTLDVHLRPTGETFQVNNTAQGISILISKLQPLKPTRIILEATAGMEREAALSLAEVDLGWVGSSQSR